LSRAGVVAALVLAAGCGPSVDKVLCGSADCVFTREEWQQLQSLAGLPEKPPDDPSNKYASNPKAAALGQKLYFDPRFSGNATLLDSLRRPTPYARSAKGQPTNISCATCHDPARGGADFTSNPNHVSIGAGWYDVNSQQTVNAAYYGIIYWNGRNDSLWSQIVAVAESFVSMGSNRLKIAWLMKDKYEADYADLFTAHPLPFATGSADRAVQPGGRHLPFRLSLGHRHRHLGLVLAALSARGPAGQRPRMPGRRGG
jgi:cytochrome c peroxidase